MFLQSRTPARLLFVFVGALLLTLPGAGVVAGDADAEQRLPAGDLAGLEERLRQDRGHPVLVNFWATWCLPCIHEIPELNRMSEELGPRGARFLAVSLDGFVYPEPDDARRRVAELVKKESFTLPVFLYSGDRDALSQKYELPEGLPHTILLDSDGKLLIRIEGQLREQEIERLTDSIREGLAAREP